MINYDQLKDFANLPLKTRYNLLLAAIIVVLCSVIVYYERKQTKTREDYRTTINSIVTRSNAREAALEAKLEVCNQSAIMYAQKNEEELRQILFETKRLKEKIEDNENTR